MILGQKFQFHGKNLLFFLFVKFVISKTKSRKFTIKVITEDFAKFAILQQKLLFYEENL